jgi:hypothetical protein
MSVLDDNVGPMDRTGDFQALALREQFLKLARSRLRAGLRAGRSAAGPVAVQL